MNKFNSNRHKRKLAIRSKIKGTARRPRLSIFRSSKHLYLQLIDDNLGQTLASFSDLLLSTEEKKGKDKKEVSFLVGFKLAKEGLKKDIQKVIFDRGGFLYHGRVKAAAEGARKGGLIF